MPLLQAVPGAMELVVLLLILAFFAVPAIIVVGVVVYFVVLRGGAVAVNEAADDPGAGATDETATGATATETAVAEQANVGGEGTEHGVAEAASGDVVPADEDQQHSATPGPGSDGAPEEDGESRGP